MQSSSRPNFWIPPESTFETAVPSPTGATAPAHEPPTPTRGNTRFNRPPLPLPSPQKQSQRQPRNTPPAYSHPPPPVRHSNDRTGKEYNRRERRFESIFDSWSQEVARLQEEHRAVSLKCRNEEESTTAMNNFNRKVQAVMTRYNEEIEALQMSSSEPPSSQSENEDEEESPAPTPSRNHSFHLQNDGSNDEEEDEEDEEDEETDSADDGGDDDDGNVHPAGDDPPEHALDDEEEDEEDEEDGERASTPLSEAMHVDMSSGDDTDHSGRLSRRSVQSHQSSEISHGSLNLNTPPPTEVDEDHRAARRRQARERRKTDELASALPQRLRSETLRGVSPASSNSAVRPAAMSLFENLSSSPASISSTPAQHLGSPYSSRRPSRDVPTTRPSPIEVDPAAIASRIDYLRRQNSTSGSDRSLSRNRQTSVTDERTLFRDQFESWKSSIQNQSETVLKNAEKQTEDVKQKFQKEQEEKHQRAQQIFIAGQERLLQSFSRNRAGSTGSTATSGSPAVGSHPRNGSFAMPHAPSISPTLQRGVPSPIPPSSSPAGRPLLNKVSQTFNYASTSGLSQSPPQPSSSRPWVARTAPMSPQPENRHSTASSSGSDEVEGTVEEEEDDGQAAYKGTPPISIPNSARGSFDMGHRRTSSQVYSGTSGASSTPRNPFPQHLRNSSSTTFSSNGTSNGTASARSSGGWSGVSGTSTNTTVTSSDTPGSRRGSVGEKTFVPPTGLHGESRKNINGLTVGTSPPNQQPRWPHTAMVGSVDAPGSATHSPASTFSRASGAAVANVVNIPPRATAQQWHTAASASSPSAASAVPPNVNPSNIASGSLPRPNPVGPLNINQSPGKSSWKSTATGKPSPPIPIQTRPSGSTSSAQRNWPDTSFAPGSFSSSTAPIQFGPSARASPSLRGSMSNADLVSTAETHATLKSRPSTSTFAIPDQSIGRPSRPKSPKKPVNIPAKAAPSPAKLSSTPPDPQLSDHSASSQEADAPPPETLTPRREEKQKAGLNRRAKKDEADRRKREEDLARREEEIKRREAELEKKRLQEKKLQEREAERQREEDLARREAEIARREEELKRQEAEVAEAKRRRQAEAEAKRKKEAELKRQRDLEEEARRKKEAEIRRQQEAERKRQQEAERKRQQEEELRKQREEELRRQEEEEELRRQQEEEEELRRQEEEEELRRQQEEEELRKQQEAEEEAERLRKEGEEEAIRQQEILRKKEEEERQARRNLEESERRSQPKKKGNKKRNKPSVDEQRELEAARERERAAEEEQRQMLEAIRIEEEAFRESQREEDARIAAEEARLEEERIEAERLELLMREQRKQELYRQEQAALEEARQRQRAKEEKRQAEERRMHMRQDEERRQAWARQQEQERAARQEEERRAQEARIREQNDRMTEMFQARDRSNQINSNMPKRYADAWDAYDEKWRRLASEVLAGAQPSITFATLPWPLLNPPSSPDAITRNAVGAFILSQWHSKNKTPRDRIRDALLRWHPDRFGRYLSCAPEGEERDNVKIGVGNVARSLNELLTKESPSAPL